jgi:lipase
MLLHSREWGAPSQEPVICVHGLAQHGSVFAELGGSLARAGRRVVAVDLRGHGASGYEPPWDVRTHADDLLETVSALGIESADWVGHSFGGRILAALAATVPQRVKRLALLDPGLSVPAEYALAGVERDRQDWSFASAEGAVNALLSTEAIVAAPRQTVAAYVADDLVRGADGRLRFRYSPGALVTAWSEMAGPPAAVAQLPTLLVRPVAVASGPSREQDLRYRRELCSLLTMAAVPNGHNVLWEAPAETIAAVLAFLSAG